MGKGSKTVLVGDADCTGDGESLCQEVGVQGYPTIKYGDPSALEDYNGGRDFDELKKFTEEIKPTCSPSNIDLCDADAKKKIEDLQALSVEDLDAKIEEKEKDEAIKAVKENGLGLMKAVKAGKTKKKEEL